LKLRFNRLSKLKGLSCSLSPQCRSFPWKSSWQGSPSMGVQRREIRFGGLCTLLTHPGSGHVVCLCQRLVQAPAGLQGNREERESGRERAVASSAIITAQVAFSREGRPCRKPHRGMLAWANDHRKSATNTTLAFKLCIVIGFRNGCSVIRKVPVFGSLICFGYPVKTHYRPAMPFGNRKIYIL